MIGKTFYYLDEIQCHFLENLLTITPNVVFENIYNFQNIFLNICTALANHTFQYSRQLSFRILKIASSGKLGVLLFCQEIERETKTQRKGMGGRGSAVQPPNINLSISCCEYSFKKSFLKFCFTALTVFMPQTSRKSCSATS